MWTRFPVSPSIPTPAGFHGARPGYYRQVRLDYSLRFPAWRTPNTVSSACAIPSTHPDARTAVPDHLPVSWSSIWSDAWSGYVFRELPIKRTLGVLWQRPDHRAGE